MSIPDLVAARRILSGDDLDSLQWAMIKAIMDNPGRVVLHSAARTLGVLPPAYDTSADAGRPYKPTNQPINQDMGPGI